MEIQWYVFQIGNDLKPNFYRFIIIQGTYDRCESSVNSELQNHEYIDTTTTLSDILGGEVLVVTYYSGTTR